jgi:transposase
LQSTLTRVLPTPEELPGSFEPSAGAIRNWVVQASRDDGRRSDGLTSEEKRSSGSRAARIGCCREEREIPRKAAPWFTTETTSIPSRDSNS